MSYKTTYHVRGHEIDPAYKLKQHYVVSYFFDCFARYCSELSLAAFDIQKEGKSWVISDILVDFSDKKVAWNTQVNAEVSFRPCKGIRIEVDFTLTSDGQEIAKGTSRWVIIDENSRRPVPLPLAKEKIAQEVGKNERNTLNEKTVYLPFEDNPGENIFTQEVRFSHIDFNHHLNSLQYFSIAIDSLETPFLLSHSPKTLRAKFEREVYLKQNVRVMLLKTKEKTSHTLLRENGEELESAFRMDIEWHKTS